MTPFLIGRSFAEGYVVIEKEAAKTGGRQMFWQGRRTDPYNVTVDLFREALGPRGLIHPPRMQCDVFRRGVWGGPYDAVTALSLATRLAEQNHCDVTVVDRDKCWRPAWGILN